MDMPNVFSICISVLPLLPTYSHTERLQDRGSGEIKTSFLPSQHFAWKASLQNQWWFWNLSTVLSVCVVTESADISSIKSFRPNLLLCWRGLGKEIMSPQGIEFLPPFLFHYVVSLPHLPHSSFAKCIIKYTVPIPIVSLTLSGCRTGFSSRCSLPFQLIPEQDISAYMGYHFTRRVPFSPITWGSVSCQFFLPVHPVYM